MQGTVVAVSISERKGQRKQNVARGRLRADHGLENDAHAGPGHRQVSLLAAESIQQMLAKGLKVGPGDFAENVTTQGLDLARLPLGTRLRLGEAVLEITQIGKECHNHCAIYHQAGDCVMPREGVFARVLISGDIFPGLIVQIERNQP